MQEKWKALDQHWSIMSKLCHSKLHTPKVKIKLATTGPATIIAVNTYQFL